MSNKLLLKKGVSFVWATKNPVLKEGEPGYETDTHKLKIGDGFHRWSELPYYLNEVDIEQYIDEVIDKNPGGAVTQQDLLDHINAQLPHPVYDDGPSFLLLYENAKV